MPPEKQDPKNPFARTSAWGSSHDGAMRFTPMTKLGAQPITAAPEPEAPPVVEPAQAEPPRRTITPSPPVRSILTGSALPTPLRKGAADTYPTPAREAQLGTPASGQTPSQAAMRPRTPPTAAAAPAAEPPRPTVPPIPVTPVKMRARRRRRSSSLLVIGAGSALVVGAIAVVVMMFSRTTSPPPAAVATTEPAVAPAEAEQLGLAPVESADGSLRGPIGPRLSEARVTPQTATPPQAPGRAKPAGARVATAPKPATSPEAQPPVPAQIDVSPVPITPPPAEITPVPPPDEAAVGLTDPESAMPKRRADTP